MAPPLLGRALKSLRYYQAYNSGSQVSLQVVTYDKDADHDLIARGVDFLESRGRFLCAYRILSRLLRKQTTEYRE